MERLLIAHERVGTPLVDKVALFTAASETFSKKNTNATISQTIERFRPVLALARQHNLAVRIYVSCAVECPYEGPIAPDQVARVVAMLEPLAPDEIDLGDTIGAGTPETIARMLASARSASPWTQTLDPESWVLHLHDTRGRAAAYVRAALDEGVRSFDASAGGLGGCPFACTPGNRAPGNIATETLVDTVVDAGYEVRVDRARLQRAGDFARGLIADAGER